MAKRRATQHYRIKMFRPKQEKMPSGEETLQQLIPDSNGNLRIL